MILATLNNVMTGSPMGDTSIILKDYIKLGYIITQPPKTDVNFDTKFARMDKYYHVIVESMPNGLEFQELGGARFRVSDVKRIQIFASRTSAINDKFLMERHILDIINANPLGMQGSGVQQAFITNFNPIIYQKDAKTDKFEVDITTISRSFALCTLEYELLRT